MPDSFPHIYAGQGQGRRSNQPEPIFCHARCRISENGDTTVWILDCVTGAQREWRGTVQPSRFIYLTAPTEGRYPDTAVGMAQFEPDGTLCFEVQIEGANLVAVQWRFILAPLS